MTAFKLPLAEWIDAIVNWLQVHWKPLFQLISHLIQPTVDFFQRFLTVMPSLVTILLIGTIAWWISRFRIAIFTIIGLLLIDHLGYWKASIETLSLVLTATLISLIIGIPIGLWSGKDERIQNIVKPILDFMQTMPAFVYLIPAVFFFSLGTIPGVFASVIFAMPPTIRFTSLGLRQVSLELKEAADAFGSTPWQKLWKVEIPLAKPTILAGINQTIMLSLSMVVVSSMIGAGGLGSIVLESISRLKVGRGFEAGLSIVIIAILLDRLTQNVGDQSNKKRQGYSFWRKWTGIVLSVVIGVLAIISIFPREEGEKVTLAYVNWETEIASTHVLKNVLESQGFQVEMKQVEAGPMWQGVASGTVDAHVAAWLPTTSKPLMEASKGKVDDLGPNLEGTRVGLVVPKYVSIRSIDELASVSDRFKGQIIGIDPGAGLMSKTQSVIKNYHLPMKLVEGSDAAMTASLAKAIKEKEWIVVTGWVPHWKFAIYDLKFLEDPKGMYGGTESIHTIVRKGLKQDKPKVYQIIDRFHWTVNDMQEVMMKIHSGTSPDAAAKEWIQKHPKLVKQWVK
ncbi:glycine betaine/proline transport system substrate-binding protein [Seinonella peptonophila]|uniref:Glycine betaine/proline transport system substrate-binding protein n=1 Tax=Seinonella peptonophila TaxID=112248 RepID=A0A1M4SU57_9BACL|nr:ABC transporter permease/substrate binding protein [Seinonella peptonophila]SHE35763.1 glycine betaine/proline transport system substrate-binding protein [Seinonella peptonophila]